MQKYIFVLAQVLLALAANAQSGSKNFVLSRTFKKSNGEVNNVSQVQIQVNYLDALGRPSQTVNVAQSPSGADMIVPIEYDGYGRQSRKYLPYTASGGNGGFQSGALAAQQAFYSTSNTAGLEEPKSDLGNAYHNTGLESSVLGRPLNETGPGAKSNASSIIYGSNTDSEVKLYTYSSGSVSTSSNYPAGRLFKKRTVDEESKETTEFIDINGLLICRKVGSEALTTYFVYDDLKRLRAVLQPQYQEAGATLGEFAFLYDYDLRGRMISKKLPGVAQIEMVYDIYDRLVLSQNGNQSGTKWSFTKYDAFNRVIMTGEIPSDKSRSDWQTKYDAVTAHHETVAGGTLGYSLNATSVASAPGFPQIQESHVLLVNYYDNYNQLPASVAYSNIYGNGKIDNARTYQTGSRVKMLTAASNWLATAFYYDSEYRVVQTVKELNLATGAVERTSTKYKYDLAPLIQEQTISQQLTGPLDDPVARTGTLEPDNLVVEMGPVTHTVLKNFEYDHADRLLSVKEKFSLNGTSKGKEAYTVANKYDELGQLKEKWQHSANGTDFRRKTVFTYNIRGWATDGKTYFKKGKTDTQDSLFFAYKLSYVSAANTSKYSNGNISKAEWSGKSQNTFKNGLAFTYDGANRLTSAGNAGGTQYTYKETETGISYDKNGNIKTLTRGGPAGNIDQLTYNYGSTISNRLSFIKDDSGNNAGVKAGTSPTYTYDANGNMTKDAARDAIITYNYINLPNSVKVGTGPTSIYEYDAAGTKHKYAADSTFKYEGAFEYNQDNAFKRLAITDGQLIMRGGALELNYYIKDHLGNVRVVFDSDGKTKQQTDYYPFGLEIDKSSPLQSQNVRNEVNRYSFQGQERQIGSDYIQFKWRLHDPATGRFLSVDPLGENFYFNSTYAFAENRVINGIELEGLEWENFMSKFKNPNQLSVKPVPSGNGVQNQSYQVVVQNPKKGLSDLRTAFRDSPQKILSNSKADFQAVDGEGNRLEKADLKKGSYIKIDIFGPMNNSYVKVTDEESDSDKFSYTFRTLEGHIEAGQITFSASKDKNGNITFGIKSTSKVDMGMAPEEFSRSQQAKSWQEVLTNAVKYLQGTEASRKVQTKKQK